MASVEQLAQLGAKPAKAKRKRVRNRKKPGVVSKIVNAVKPEHKLPAIIKAVGLMDVTKPDDCMRAYQPVIFWMQGDTVVKKQVIHKRDTFTMAYAIGQEALDPNNKAYEL